MKSVICSKILPNNIKKSLLNEGFSLIEGGFSTVIDNETRYHPDMLYFKLPSGKLLVSDKINSVHNLDTFVSVEKTRTLQGASYPKDCVLNCFTAEKHLICGGYVADEIIEECNRHSVKIINVKQGYAACSTVKVTPQAFITADTGIAKALINKQYDVLLVTNNGIELKGYNNGFIGGCALTTDDAIYFTGDISKHTDCNKIISFCKKYNKKVKCLTVDNLYDYGGFIVL